MVKIMSHTPEDTARGVIDRCADCDVCRHLMDISYLYPQVAKAAVAFLEASGIPVWFPPQQCCGMPAYLEGDKKRALKFAQASLEQLCDALDDGFDIVTSCPTCGFMFRNLLKSGAYYAKEYQTAIGAAPDLILTPKSENSVDGKPGFFKHKKAIYGKILVDDGVFADISALKRVKVAEHIFDIGEYVVRIGNNAKHPVKADHIGSKMVYFPPCLYEQVD